MLVGLERLRDDAVQPGSPLLQRLLLLQSHLEVLLQPLHHAVLTLTHPGRLLLKGTAERVGTCSLRLKRQRTRTDGEEGDGSTNLYVSEIDPVEVREHLVDLGRVLQDRAGGLSQVVQASVAPQCLGEGAYTHHLMERGRSYNNVPIGKTEAA